ncbi:LysR family transcriptional regulator [Psychromonas marina]|uniref:LysR family transcriptional regulator n=1 Tax=Psychromonas marina TaxID=88364 RepID=A0ABQ6DW42_9GAMM|nr:LysR family transcriptional regulator [Psychromonas marina]GLS89331.1 LysR family transcriptional regulator [Psychromonas marina]
MTHFSFTQLNSFVTVAQVKSFTKAAAVLRKDRKTISEHIEYFEINLGYPVFSKLGRTLVLTSKGELLYRRAQLLSADVRAFERFAMSLDSAITDRISICFDESIPYSWLKSLQSLCGDINVTLDLVKVTREYGETLLKSGACQYGLFLAKGEVINAEFYWKSLPSISMSAFTLRNNIIANTSVNTLRDLAKFKQRIYSQTPSVRYRYPLIVSDDHVIESDLELLLAGLTSEQNCWAFIPNHLSARVPDIFTKVNLDIVQANQEIKLQTVLLWASSQPNGYDAIIKLTDTFSI